MGGIGSGRKETENKKELVENCLCLFVANLKPKLKLSYTHNSGTIKWLDKPAVVNYRLFHTRKHSILNLIYYLNKEQKIVQPITMTSTFPYFGGYQKWFLCPKCEKRVRKLYFPYGAQEFLCRHCHNLTYMSSQTQKRKGFEHIFWDCEAKRKANENIHLTINPI